MKRLWWCLAVFVFGVALGNFLAPPVISAMKPLDNGAYEVEWSDDTREVFVVSGPEKKAVVNVRGEEMEISRSSMETPLGLVFFFPWQPEHRSFPFFDAETGLSAPLDYVGPTEIAGLRALRFSGTFDTEEGQVTRTFDVERRTGRVLDASRTTSAGTVTLAESTKSMLIDDASSLTRTLWWLQFLTLLGRLFAVSAVVVGVVTLVRRR